MWAKFKMLFRPGSSDVYHKKQFLRAILKKQNVMKMPFAHEIIKF